MQKKKLGARVWAAILIFGLFGQIAWMVENMYFNVFVYDTISDDPGVIANMVFFSALTATVTTLVMGALSDKVGKRKVFMTAGYIVWGFSTMAFSFISIGNMQQLMGPAAAVQAAIVLVIVMDCVMTFFGSTANDAAFNAWINDVTEENQRGRVESVLAILPLVAMLIIFGGFVGLTQQGKWDIFFLIIGGLVTLGGIVGIFVIKDSPDLKPGTDKYFHNIVYGFRPSVVRRHAPLYITLCAVGVLGISTQVFMPYLIIYIQRYLGIEDYALLLAVVLVSSSILSVACGKLIDKVGKARFVYPAVVLEIAGLIGMFFARGIGLLIPMGFLMLGGNMLVTACVNGLVRDYTPPDKSGLFQGIRMLFSVLIPMAVGPYIGAAIIRDSDAYYEDLGVLKQVPTPGIFIGSAAALVFIVLPLLLLHRRTRKTEANA